MKRIYLIGIWLWCIAIAFTGCTKTDSQTEKRGYMVKGDTVKVLQTNWSDILTVERVMALPYTRKIVTAGTVRPIPTQYANIAPPFAGRVVKCYVQMGQEVEQGTSLFDINCPDFTAAQKDFFQARSTYELAKKDLERKKDLSHNGVSSQKELEEAETAMMIAEKDLENTEAALHVYQDANLDGMKLGQPLVVRAPISGLLIENNIVTGQYLKDDVDPVAVVADLSHVWVSAQVKEKDIRFITEGDKLCIDVTAYPGVRLEGEVFHVEEELDEDTRSIQVLSICKNDKEMLKLGMYVTVCFNSVPVDMPIIPETALLQGVDSNYVFVQTAPNTYVRRNVTVEATTEQGAVISEGLRQGEKIITRGGYCLKI